MCWESPPTIRVTIRRKMRRAESDRLPSPPHKEGNFWLLRIERHSQRVALSLLVKNIPLPFLRWADSRILTAG